MTDINVEDAAIGTEVVEQSAAAAIVAEVSGNDHKLMVTTSRCLAEEFRTPLESDDTMFARQAVAYIYTSDDGAPAQARLIENLGVMSYSQGKTYTREELLAYIQTLSSIAARIM